MIKKHCILILTLVLLLSGCTAGQKPADTPEPDASAQVADSGQMAPVQDVVDENMTPVYGESLKDGVYSVEVDSSSSMFNIESCELTVENGEMTAAMHMGGKGYLSVFMGTGEQAAKAGQADVISFTEEADGSHTFVVPVEALDKGLACAAYSKNKELWYDRTLVFRADSLPMDAFQEGFFATVSSLGLEDGSYTVEVELAGGSGRAAVQSPAELRIENGVAVAVVVWSSSSYDYMRIDEEKYLPMQTEDGSTFELPVACFDRKLTVFADTTAMSTPHEIEYTLYFDSASIKPAA